MDRAVSYQRKKKMKKRTPPIVGDITTKNCVRQSEHLHVKNSRGSTCRDQRPFTPIFGEDWPGGVNECRGSQHRDGDPNLHGVLDIGLL